MAQVAATVRQSLAQRYEELRDKERKLDLDKQRLDAAEKKLDEALEKLDLALGKLMAERARLTELPDADEAMTHRQMMDLHIEQRKAHTEARKAHTQARQEHTEARKAYTMTLSKMYRLQEEESKAAARECERKQESERKQELERKQESEREREHADAKVPTYLQWMLDNRTSKSFSRYPLDLLSCILAHPTFGSPFDANKKSS